MKNPFRNQDPLASEAAIPGARISSWFEKSPGKVGKTSGEGLGECPLRFQNETPVSP
jgi:hypothetical protein